MVIYRGEGPLDWMLESWWVLLALGHYGDRPWIPGLSATWGLP